MGIKKKSQNVSQHIHGSLLGHTKLLSRENLNYHLKDKALFTGSKRASREGGEMCSLIAPNFEGNVNG